MKTTMHVHAEKAGLIIDVVRKWPVKWITDGEGKPYATVHEAVQAIVDLPTRYVPMGCPTPDDDGRCPGHES